MDYAGSSPLYAVPTRSNKAKMLRERLAALESDNITPDQPMGPELNTTQRGGSFVDEARRELVGDGFIQNPNAGKVRVMTDEAMTPAQRQQIAQAAMAQAGQRTPLRATFEGREFTMPASGPRVSGAKAKSFLELARQSELEQRQRVKESIDQRRMDEDLAERKRQQNLMEQMAIEDRQRRAKREDYEMERMQRGDARSDLERERGRKAEIFKAAIAAETDPTKRGQLMEEYARSQFALPSPGLPTGGIAGPALGAVNRAVDAASDASTSFIRPGMFAPSGSKVKAFQAQEGRESMGRATEIISSDPIIASEIAMLSQDLAEAGDLPWIQDVGDFFKFGLMDPAKANDARVQGVIAKIRGVAQSAARRYPDVPEEQIYQLLVGQLAPQLGGMAPGPAMQFRTALRQPSPAF